MKTRLFFIFLLASFIGNAQQQYYSDVDLTKTGLELKTELATKIINTHTNFLSYTPGVWEASKITDIDPENATNVILFYGWEDGSDTDVTNDRTRGKDNNGGSNGDWNREHSYPKSLGNPNLGESGPGADAHHLRPTDVQRNSNRGSRTFADGSGNSGTTAQGNWYPGDEWKGDVARMMMYMYLRYEDRCLPSVVGVGNNTNTPDDMIDLFLEWNVEDPVSIIEDNRNAYHDSNGTYAQGNRNPFIDNPYLATAIWGGDMAEDRWGIVIPDTEDPTVPTNLIVSNETPVTIDLSWTASTDNVSVTAYDIYVNGILNTSVSATNALIEGLTPETTYSFTVIAKDAAGNSSLQSMAINGTTTPPDTEAPTVPTNLTVSDETATSINLFWAASTDNVAVTAYEIYIDGLFDSTVIDSNVAIFGLSPETTYAFSVRAIDAAGNGSAQSIAVNGTTTADTSGDNAELFISEYVEGSGFNKAIEIANFTDQIVDLANYSLQRQSGGAGAWETGLTLSGTLNIDEVVVIINDDTTDATLLAEADILVDNASPMTFNGNDPVGLFKNGVLIDIVGTFDGGSANFAKDVTLRRKNTIASPNTTFNLATEWDSYASNTTDNIGTHEIIILNTPEFNSSQRIVTLYPNPSNGNVHIQFTKNQAIESVEIYNLLGKRIFNVVNISASNNSIELFNLPKGILLVNITSSKHSITRKLVVK